MTKPTRKPIKSRPGIQAWCPICGRTRKFRTVRERIVYQFTHELERNRHLVILYAHGCCSEAIWDEMCDPLWDEENEDDQDEDEDDESNVRA